MLAQLFSNFPLVASVVAIIFAQVIKIPIRLIVVREFTPGLVFSTGSMPSSHSAAVTALATAVGLSEGINSTYFAIAFVFCLITMFDALGIRREAGEHAVILNRLVTDFQTFFETAPNWLKMKEYERIRELRTLLGHKPIEVLAGAFTGIAIALIVYLFYLALH